MNRLVADCVKVDHDFFSFFVFDRKEKKLSVSLFSFSSTHKNWNKLSNIQKSKWKILRKANIIKGKKDSVWEIVLASDIDFWQRPHTVFRFRYCHKRSNMTSIDEEILKWNIQKTKKNKKKLLAIGNNNKNTSPHQNKFTSFIHWLTMNNFEEENYLWPICFLGYSCINKLARKSFLIFNILC